MDTHICEGTEQIQIRNSAGQYYIEIDLNIGYKNNIGEYCDDIALMIFTYCKWQQIIKKNIRKGGYIMIPQDPAMLLSFINLKLRDYYPSLEKLCDDLDIDRTVIEDKLSSIDYHYDKEKNQFV